MDSRAEEAVDLVEALKRLSKQTGKTYTVISIPPLQRHLARKLHINVDRSCLQLSPKCRLVATPA